MAGLVLGALMGLLLTVFFEDYLKDRRSRVGRRVRRLVARGGLPEQRAEFHLGPLKCPMLIVEGDGEQVINEQSVRVVVDHDPVELPAEMVPWRDEVAAEQERRRAAGEHAFWNGPNYAVSGFTVSRTALDESPEVALRLRPADYYTFLTAQQLDREFADGTTPRERYLAPTTPLDVPDFLNCSFGTNVAVITADNLLVVQQRSTRVGSQPGTWSSSANEALSRQLDSRGRSAPNLYDVMRRGIVEELAIEETEYHLELLAFTIDTRRQQWGALFVAFLHDLTGADLVERRSKGVADKWEHDRMEFEAFEVAPVVRMLLSPQRRDRWSSVGPPLFYLALIRKYGRAHVERRAAVELRRLGLK
ncbi:hypothetical protein [Saccharothrix saharensis]|uniref:hypothetical protein n=1 Tax=Saccharothrix saharensis TaxID=571190 RepID=UPI001B8794FD|nr:hypothetical protein [Saccharothrix saharensis]